jgi:uncharacterized membrane protein YfcA
MLILCKFKTLSKPLAKHRKNIMWVEIGRWLVILFGLFFIFVAVIMLTKPRIARETLRKAGSTNFINYAEITLRMIPAIGLILVAEESRSPSLFTIVGWFMLLTSLVLYFVPRKWHHHFSNKAANVLKPIYFQIISPFAIII